MREVFKIRILLLNPPAEQKYVKESRCQHRAAVFQSVYPPLTLAYIASLLRKENNILLLDAIGRGTNYEELERKVLNFMPELMIVNTSTPTINNDLAVIKKLKEKTKAISCIFGVHATHFANELIKLPEVDVVIKGEPEFVSLELTKKNFEDVMGICYKKNGKIMENPNARPIDLNELPFPAWDMINLNDYRMPIINKKYVLLVTGRGCPYPCTFCVASSYYGKRVRTRSVESVLNEIKYVKNLGIDDIFFFEETFTLNKKFVMNLCNKMIEDNLNIWWVCNSRVDTLDEEMLKIMKKAGCWMMSFGLESSDQKILDNVKKGIIAEQSKIAIETTKKSGIATVGHFIFGLPGETEKSIESTIKFSLELPLDFAEFYIATPYPGAPLFDDLGIINHFDIDWNQFEYSHNVIRKDLNLESKRKGAYRRFYMRLRTFMNMVRIFGFKSIITIVYSGIRFLMNI